jgi:hypothetical protein
MKNPRSIADPPFRLRQESAGPRRRSERQFGGLRTLEAWPTGQGDYFLAGRDTYPIKDRIAAAGGRWDHGARRWFVSKEQAQRLGATILVRVLRAPACCEKHVQPGDTIGGEFLPVPPERGIPAYATYAEVLAGKMKVPFCPYCDSHCLELVAIRDVLDTADLPELPEAKWLPTSEVPF